MNTVDRRSAWAIGLAAASAAVVKPAAAYVPQENLRVDRRTAGRSGCVDQNLQPRAATSGQMVLRKDADADIP